jgi:DNA-binding IclR family transcriptional regulator
LDLEFLRLAHRAATRLPIPPTAAEHLRAMVAQIDETGALALYDPQRRRMSFQTVLHSSKPLRYVVETDVWIPVTAGASGLAILAYLPAEERARLLAEPLPAYTAHTITNPIALETELARIRERGYAISHGHRAAGAVAIAAPFFGPGAKVVGDAVLTIPEARFDASREDEFASAVCACSGEITRELGGLAPPT